ncbi:MAG: hypothetical protein MHM6MM_005887 [Cercozoa sp. M6MM]
MLEGDRVSFAFKHVPLLLRASENDKTESESTRVSGGARLCHACLHTVAVVLEGKNRTVALVSRSSDADGQFDVQFRQIEIDEDRGEIVEITGGLDFLLLLLEDGSVARISLSATGSYGAGDFNSSSPTSFAQEDMPLQAEVPIEFDAQVTGQRASQVCAGHAHGAVRVEDAVYVFGLNAPSVDSDSVVTTDAKQAKKYTSDPLCVPREQMYAALRPVLLDDVEATSVSCGPYSTHIQFSPMSYT